MDFGYFFDNLWELLKNRDQYYRFNLLCIENGNSTIVESVVRNIKVIYKQISTECVINSYHELRSAQKLDGKDRATRISSFLTKYLNNPQYACDFLEKYPVIRDALRRTTSDYLLLCSEIIERYYHDITNIESTFGEYYGDIVEIALPSGDLHNGKAVTIVNLENGKLVYKPRDLSTDRILESYVSYIASRIPQTPHFYFLKGYQGEGYSWQEYAKAIPCSDMDEVHRFFYRAGVYLAVFYLFSSNDMHYDNMICFGEHPVFFDVETLITSKLEYGSVNLRTVTNSVLATNILPISIASAAADVNMSALFTGKHQSKKVTQYMIEPDEELDWVFSKRFLTIEGKNNRVICQGKEIPAVFVESDIISGFSQAMSVVISNKKEVSHMIEMIDGSTKIRQVIRPTQVYGHFISAYRNPLYATDLRNIDRILDILYRKFTPGSHGYLRVEREVDDLSHGYIPSFYARVNDRDLFSSMDDKLICHDYFLYCPRDIVLNKLLHLDQSMIDYQVRLISMSLLLTHDIQDLRSTEAIEGNVELLGGSYSALEIIKEYVEYIKKNIVSFDNGQYTLVLPAIRDEGFFIHGLDFGLYDSGGTILLLAMYAHHFDESFKDTVKGMLNSLIAKYHIGRNAQANTLNYSLSNGIAGFLYVTYNVSKLWQDQSLHSLCMTMADDVLNHYLTDIEDNTFDFLGGVPGALYLLCKMCMAEGTNVNCDAVKRLGYQLNEKIMSIDCTSLEYGFAHGRTGLAVALSGLFQITGDSTIIDAIHRLLPTSIDELSMESWCRGKAGYFLACKLVAENTGESTFIERTRLDNFAELLNLRNQDNACLCHGYWGNVDILNSLGFLDFLKDKIPTEGGLRSIMDLHFIKGSSYQYEPFMGGGAGVAYALLRLIAKAPSVLSLEIL